MAYKQNAAVQFYSSKLVHSATDHTATICQIIPENKNPPKDFVTPIRWDKTLGLISEAAASTCFANHLLVTRILIIKIIS